MDAGETHKPFNFRWPKESICTLGIYFSYSTEHADKLEFQEKITILEKTLNGWKWRKLTPLGRLNVVKTSGLSKLIYNVSVLTIPKHFVKEINRISFNYTWEGKPAKVEITIIRENKLGGLKLLDFENSLIIKLLCA